MDYEVTFAREILKDEPGIGPIFQVEVTPEAVVIHSKQCRISLGRAWKMRIYFFLGVIAAGGMLFIWRSPLFLHLGAQLYWLLVALCVLLLIAGGYALSFRAYVTKVPRATLAVCCSAITSGESRQSSIKRTSRMSRPKRSKSPCTLPVSP